MEQVQAADSDAGMRLDQFLSARIAQYSRSRLQEWIRRGRVLVDGREQKASYAIRGSEVITVEPEAPPPLHAFAEDLPVRVLYSDDDVIAVDKPAGMVVHAGAGRHEGTLVNALLHHFGTLSSGTAEDRPGIVHRIDKDTSGVLLVARNDAAHRMLAAQFAGREVDKRYLTVVQGVVAADQGRIDSKISRDPVHRTRMTCRTETGRTALTQWRVRERFARHTYLEVKIGTGRTHQIRVHLSSIGHPVAGDNLYGATAAPERGRFFLHAWRITFRRPSDGETVTAEAPLPPELERWVDDLRYTKK
ncbi:MAG TPA: RluA family pseudouridine synthase [Bryobacteraceae bacterium]|nr:RluA family pseudouridine synthase [Bryobacteraceae bacterium]